MMILMTLSLLVSIMTPPALAACDCEGDLSCYRDKCRTAGEISVLAFEAGKHHEQNKTKYLLAPYVKEIKELYECSMNDIEYYSNYSMHAHADVRESEK